MSGTGRTADILRPRDEKDLCAAIAGLAARGTAAEVKGAGSKRGLGRPIVGEVVVETVGLSGLTLYEPTELVMAARAGTPLAEIEKALAERGQMLAFEPVDLGPVSGGAAGTQTIGGVFATAVSGSRRIQMGAARDHILGVRAVNGRGEIFKSGGRVLKNVTGYDVGRALVGSWGTLAVLSELTFKVMPLPERSETLIFPGLTEEIAVEAMCAALGSPFEVSGTVHLTAALTPRLETKAVAREAGPVTAIRIENFGTSVNYRTGRLAEALKVYGQPQRLGHEVSLRFWQELRRLSIFTRQAAEGSRQLWRLSTAPRKVAAVMTAIRRNTEAEACLDASGGIIWLEVPASADAGAADIRRILAGHGGHATLISAAADVRGAVEVFHPMSTTVERLSTGLKNAFDPLRILNRGRMYAAL